MHRFPPKTSLSKVLGVNKKYLKLIFLVRKSDSKDMYNTESINQNITCCSFEFLVIKGVIGSKMHFYKLLELKYVLAVCVHNHLIMIKIFLISLNNFPFLKCLSV